MSVLSDRWIKKMAIEKEMIKPFVPKQTRGNNISYGLSSFGYDARVSNELIQKILIQIVLFQE